MNALISVLPIFQGASMPLAIPERCDSGDNSPDLERRRDSIPALIRPDDKGRTKRLDGRVGIDRGGEKAVV